MPGYRRRKRPLPRTNLLLRRRVALILILIGFTAIIIPLSLYLRKLSGQIAISDASDLVTIQISNTIEEMMADGKFEYDYFVSLQKNEAGDITAITANMPRINTLSAEILNDIVAASGGGELDLGIPVGNLTGLNLLVGRGPEIPVRVIMLTSSRADFRNEIVSAGINQTKHQMILEVVVDIDILIPWEILSTQVVTEVMVAETIIVGSVPDTYLSLENDDGSTK